jgi:hypothetical protein
VWAGAEIVVEFDAFERTPKGNAPYRILDSHPDGQYLAMQSGHAESFVWERETKRIAWRPDRAIALAWLRDGMQIAVLREASDAPYEYVVYTWPEVQLLHRCPVAPPPGWGWMLDLVISPQSDLALCHWVDQAEAGFEFIDITSQGVSQDPQAGYFLEGTNEVTRPVFSPDGQLWTFGHKMYETWWVPDPEDIDTYDQPALGGTYALGELKIFRGKQPLSQSIPLIATLPTGWKPADPEAEDVLFLSDPTFLDERHIKIRLPSDETQVHRVPVD